MQQYKYFIVDSEGYILLTIVSQKTDRSFDTEADFSISPLLPIIAEKYGLEAVFYTL
jgi:hypothetical protein|tara:strand:- start:305 stop:475 length:171 start_codon:yes stop_codon:yes gene_type:complete